MMAYAWKSLGWFLSGLAVALGFLLVPLQVAAERKKLDKTIAAIAAAERDIRTLETEFDTRANLAQLEKWNGDTLGLVAPGAAQFVRDETALASVDFDRAPAPLGAVRTAVMVVPSLPAAAVSAPKAGASDAVTLAQAQDPARGIDAGEAAQAQLAASTRGKGQAVAMLDRQLLSETTIGDLLSGARSEARRAR